MGYEEEGRSQCLEDWQGEHLLGVWELEAEEALELELVRRKKRKELGSCRTVAGQEVPQEDEVVRLGVAPVVVGSKKEELVEEEPRVAEEEIAAAGGRMKKEESGEEERQELWAEREVPVPGRGWEEQQSSEEKLVPADGIAVVDWQAEGFGEQVLENVAVVEQIEEDFAEVLCTVEVEQKEEDFVVQVLCTAVVEQQEVD